MAKKTIAPRESRDLNSLLKSAKGEALPYRLIFDAISHVIPFTEALIVTSLPRGGLQIAQPQRLPDSLVKAYSKEFHLMDRPTWQAIAKHRAVRARECWPAGEYETSRYYTEFLQGQGFGYAAVAPLSAPVLDGYPGAIQVYRAESQGAFSDQDLHELSNAARDVDQAIVRLRAARQSPSCSYSAARPDFRQFIFDNQLRLQLPKVNPNLDPRLMAKMLEHARIRLGHVNGKQVTSDRVSLPDSRGDLWNFRVVLHRSYPALGDGPFVFFCIQPDSVDWSALRPGDFQADKELSRLIPAMKFMRDEFHRGPTLHEIARQVQLSPFHFHRRFTERLGITPKHFLLDCQIALAKSQLVAREKNLAAIATECGFAHQSHFTSRFKQATGLTPTRWRRMAKESQHALEN
jgi:AraC-like DNA-binding protein